MQTDASVIKLDINQIIPNKYQPRKVFDTRALTSLSESIKTYGIINPILVRKKEDKYEIIAGERRYRAAKQLGLTEIPVIIKSASEQEMAELALIENLERQGLSAIEEAKSYEEIMRIGNQTQEELAKKIGKSQSSIANKIRLLSLPYEVQNALNNKQISERHARSLISIKDKEKQIEILNRIIDEKLTVKETENIINEKDITEEEIKQAINDIMKSINIVSEENKKEEKEDDNMNNGNFFPNFDNNSANNTSLNMMNMQSMNQEPMAPAQEMVMPTANTEGMINTQPQIEMPLPVMEPTMVEPTFGPSISPEMPQMAPSMMDAPLFNPNATMDSPVMGEPQLVAPTMVEPTFGPSIAPEIPQMAPPMMDAPLFNPNVTMDSPVMGEPQLVVPTMVEPTFGPSIAPEIPQMAPSMMGTPAFEVPVMNIEQPSVDKLTELQNLLNINGYTFKILSNDVEDCVIIEIPKN